MQPDDLLLPEAQRQFLICSACRYCEGYCPTFPALESRTSYDAADVDLIAHLCHDCRACAQACMFAPPHPFAVDIPSLLSRARTATYRDRGASWSLGFSSALAALALLLIAIDADGRWGRLSLEDAAPRAFYHVVPYPWMLIPALLLAGWGAFALLRAPRFRGRAALRDWLTALRDGFALRAMRGGGEGCYGADGDPPSSRRRELHLVLVAGIGLAFAATLCAAVQQDLLHVDPPYPLSSAPVLLGATGGIAIVVGAAGLLLRKDDRTRALESPEMSALNAAFLGLLIVVAATGLLLLALRATAAMGPLLVVHLAAVAGLFFSAPYGKLLHAPLRLAALALHHKEEHTR